MVISQTFEVIANTSLGVWISMMSLILCAGAEDLLILHSLCCHQQKRILFLEAKVIHAGGGLDTRRRFLWCLAEGDHDNMHCRFSYGLRARMFFEIVRRYRCKNVGNCMHNGSPPANRAGGENTKVDVNRFALTLSTLKRNEERRR